MSTTVPSNNHSPPSNHTGGENTEKEISKVPYSMNAFVEVGQGDGKRGYLFIYMNFIVSYTQIFKQKKKKRKTIRIRVCLKAKQDGSPVILELKTLAKTDLMNF